MANMDDNSPQQDDDPQNDPEIQQFLQHEASGEKLSILTLVLILLAVAAGLFLVLKLLVGPQHTHPCSIQGKYSAHNATCWSETPDK
jgi:hypothetical protein